MDEIVYVLPKSKELATPLAFLVITCKANWRKVKKVIGDIHLS